MHEESSDDANGPIGMSFLISVRVFYILMIISVVFIADDHSLTQLTIFQRKRHIFETNKQFFNTNNTF